jgi:Ca-activated chloride channel family protein
MTARRRAAAVTAVGMALVTCLAPARAQNPVFTSRSDMVRLDILVTAGEKPVLGLKAEDFQILDNGVPQKADFVSFDELPLNVVLTFDVSGSMLGQRLDDLRAAGHSVLGQLRKDERAALVSFNEQVSLGSDLTTDLDAVGAAIDRGRAVGLTSLADASFSGLVLNGLDTGRSVMFVFSDGVDTSSWLAPSAVIDAAKRANVVVFGVTVGASKVPFLKDLSAITGGELVEVKSTRDLQKTFVSLLAEYRQRYLVGYTPTGVPADGWHEIKVTVPRKGADVRTRQGYQAR